MTKKLRIWLWISVVLAVGGALMLYPVSTAFPAPNVIFVLIKIGMVGGLMTMLFSKSRAGFPVWAACSAGAVVMTVVKWCLAASVSGGTVFLLIGSMVVDILMPSAAYMMQKRNAGTPG